MLCRKATGATGLPTVSGSTIWRPAVYSGAELFMVSIRMPSSTKKRQPDAAGDILPIKNNNRYANQLKNLPADGFASSPLPAFSHPSHHFW